MPMPFTLANLPEPRIWLRDVVQPALDDFIAAPLDIRRAYTALTLVHQHHERLYHYVQRAKPNLLTGAGLERFRIDLANLAPIFKAVAEAADPRAGHTLKYTNILSAGTLLAICGSDGNNKVRRAVIVTRVNRQLIPLLQEVISAYQRLHDKFGV